MPGESRAFYADRILSDAGEYGELTELVEEAVTLAERWKPPEHERKHVEQEDAAVAARRWELAGANSGDPETGQELRPQRLLFRRSQPRNSSWFYKDSRG